MEYKLIARDKVFCEGTIAECQKTLKNISIMLDIISTDFDIKDFVIISEEKNDF